MNTEQANRIAEIEARIKTVLDGQPIQTVMLAREIISEDIPYLLSALTHAQRERDEWKKAAELGLESIQEIKAALNECGPQEGE